MTQFRRAAQNLTETVSFRLTGDECRTLYDRAGTEERTVSQLVRLLLLPSLRQEQRDAEPAAV